MTEWEGLSELRRKRFERDQAGLKVVGLACAVALLLTLGYIAGLRAGLESCEERRLGGRVERELRASFAQCVDQSLVRFQRLRQCEAYRLGGPLPRCGGGD